MSRSHSALYDPIDPSNQQNHSVASSVIPSRSEWISTADVYTPRTQPAWQLRWAARLNVVEQLFVQLLRAVYLLPPLLQPPLTDAMREEMERAQSLLAQPVQSTPSTSGRFIGWSQSLLLSVSQCFSPNHLHPLSFRKMSVIEPSLCPTFPPATSNAQITTFILLIVFCAWLNTCWLK
jgi:hypothetical protein